MRCCGERGVSSLSLFIEPKPLLFWVLDLGNLLPFPIPNFRTSAADITRVPQPNWLFIATQVLKPRPRTNKDLVQLCSYHEESGHANDNTPFPG